ncbi:hypothetical protein M9H77_13222 [Catharanthus roseus]|uniref:Uncharacterized protein n=1 Tax=Catharanthus roseus TaxID=4058 RepID=A0ACC0BJQ4_CATRO|nr:hypothetical protein M9H77_13222 [Catharanthus roseus]
MVASWKSPYTCILFLEVLRSRQRHVRSLVILTRKIRFTKSFTNIRTTTKRLANSSTSTLPSFGQYMDLKKKEEEHSHTSAPMPIDAEMMLDVERGMTKGHAYGFGIVELARMRVDA